jgi:glycosyltransferase involved in cell wall biosynthesis
VPKVTVIIPSYNHEKYVAEAVQSVLDQTYQDFEIVITDDASQDETVRVIRNFTDPRIRIFCFEQNQGAAAAANKCINEAQGEFVAMLSSDDVFVPAKLETQVNFLDQHPEVGAVFSYAEIIDEDGNNFTQEDHFYKSIFIQPNRTRFEWLNHFFFNDNCLCHPSVLIRKSCYESVGQYDERFAQLPDLDFWVRLCLKYEIYVLPEQLIKFRIRQNEVNASGNRLDSRIRHEIELTQVLKHYLNEEVFENFIKIFPLTEKLYTLNTQPEREILAYRAEPERESVPFLLAMLALQVNRPPHKYFGINALYQILHSDNDVVQKLKEQYSFDFVKLIQLTGQQDIFGITGFEFLKTQLSQAQVQFEQAQAKLGQTQVQLTQFQTELEQTQAQLTQSQTELEQTQVQLARIQSQFEQTQAQLAQTQAEFEYSQSQLAQVQAEFKHSQVQLAHTQAHFEQADLEVSAIKSSKLWKLKRQLMPLKRLLFAAKPEVLFGVDSSVSWEITGFDLQVSGWCFSSNQIALKAVRARVADEIFSGIYGLERLDVAHAYSRLERARKSGFWIQTHLPAGQHSFVIEALDELEQWNLLETHLVTVVPVQAAFDTPILWQQPSGTVLFSGWCFHHQKKIQKLTLSCGSTCVDCSYGYYRKDVEAAYPNLPTSGYSGFEVAAFVLPGEWQVSLSAYLETGEVVTLQVPHRLLVHPNHRGKLGPSLVQPPAFVMLHPLHPYDAWLEVNQWNERSHEHLKLRLQACKDNLPKISVVMPVFNPSIQFLEAAITSVVKQVYENWELCIADDCSSDPDVAATLKRWSASDARIQVVFREENGNISAATNSAASLASSNFIAFLDHDDELTPDALGEVALYLAEHPETDFLYSDDDKIDTVGRRFSPQFKPDWSPELFLSYMYCTHLCVVRRSLFEQLEGFRVGFEGSQDYDFGLRVTEIAREVGHLPLVLYHWRAVPGSTALAGTEKPASFLAGQKALQQALDRRGVTGTVYQPEWAVAGRVGIFEYSFPDQGPSVTIIIPTKNQFAVLKTCLDSLEKTTYQNYQVVVIDNESDDPETLAYLGGLVYKVLRIENGRTGFNFAAINNRAAEQVEGDYLLFLNNDTEIITPQWLSQMVGFAQFEGVGAVGAKLLYPDGRIQHAGVIHGLHHGLAGHAFKLASGWDHGYLSYAKVARNYSAVTAACLLTPREVFLDLGGFDEGQFAVAYNDVDYCYRLLEQGYRCVYCPTAELIHREGFSRGFVDNPKEAVAFKQKYTHKVDEFYSPHLSLEDEQFKVQARRVFRGEVPRLQVLMCSNALDLTGAPLIQYELALNLASQGVVTPMIFCTHDGPLREAYEQQGIEVIIGDRPLAGIYRLEDYEEALQRLGKELEPHKIDLIYANTLENFFMVDCARMSGIPSIWNIHESESWQTYFNRFGPEISVRALECFRFPYQVIFGADATRDTYLPLNSHHNFSVIHNGLDLKQLQHKAAQWTRVEARRSLQVEPDEIAILLLGTVCERKGQQDLVQAIAQFPEQWHTRIQCFIVGDRPSSYSSQLAAMVAELPSELRHRVTLVPETSDTARYYQAADIFVCTSRIECYPRVIQEAMAYGLPIVTTPVFGIKEQVQSGVNGLFYTPDQPEELREALVTLLENESLRLRLSTNAGYVLKVLTSFEESIQTYAKIFREAYLSQSRTSHTSKEELCDTV